MYEEFQSELTPGESVLWSGRPRRSVIFHMYDLVLIPFSLVWAYITIVYEKGALGLSSFGDSSFINPASWFLALWGIPFVLIGQYAIWGRFLYAAWRKGKIFYAVTNKRVLLLDTSSRAVIAAFLEQIPTIDKSVRSDGIGTVRFGNPPVQTGDSANWGEGEGLNTGRVLTFADIENADKVFRLVSEQREKILKKD